MRICFLGTTSVDPERESSLGVVVEIDSSTRVLLDPGPYAVQGLKRIGLTPDDVSVLFASHDHADHAGGVPALIMTWLLGSARQPESMTWVVPHGALGMLDYARAAYPALLQGALPRRIDVRASVAPDVADLELIELEHTVETWGAILRTEDTSLAYLPDSTPEGMDRHADRLAGVDDVVMSVFGTSQNGPQAERFKFTTAADAGRLLTRWGAKRVFVQHLPDIEKADDVRNEMRLSFTGEIVFPRAGEWIDG